MLTKCFCHKCQSVFHQFFFQCCFNSEEEVLTSGEILNPSASEGMASNEAELQNDQHTPNTAPSTENETKLSSPIPSPGLNQEASRSQHASPDLGNAEISPAGATARK